AVFDFLQRPIDPLEPVDTASNEMSLPLERVESLRVVLEFDRSSVLVSIHRRLVKLSVLCSFDQTCTQAKEGLALFFQESGIQSRLWRLHEQLQDDSSALTLKHESRRCIAMLRFRHCRIAHLPTALRDAHHYHWSARTARRLGGTARS